MELERKIWSALEELAEQKKNFFTLDLVKLLYPHDPHLRAKRVAIFEILGKMVEKYQLGQYKQELNLSNLQLLKIYTNRYFSNLHRIKGFEIKEGVLHKRHPPIWPKVRVSYNDWLENVRLPETVDPTVSYLLGIYWGAGCLVYDKNGITLALHLYASEKEKDFFQSEVKLLVEKIHNKTLNFYPASKSGPCQQRKICTKGLTTTLSSQAVLTWLKEELNFPPPLSDKRRITLPNVAWQKDVSDSFLEGIIKTMGSYSHNGDIRVYDKDEQFIRNLNALAVISGNNPSQVWSQNNKTCYGFSFKNR